MVVSGELSMTSAREALPLELEPPDFDALPLVVDEHAPSPAARTPAAATVRSLR
jgi:hypothetical protein